MELQATLVETAGEATPETLAMVFPPVAYSPAAEGEQQGKRRGRPQKYVVLKEIDKGKNVVSAEWFTEGVGHQKPTFQVSKDAEILIDNAKQGRLADLNPGCRLQLWFVEDSERVVALVAEGPSVGARRGCMLWSVDAENEVSEKGRPNAERKASGIPRANAETKASEKKNLPAKNEEPGEKASSVGHL